jgi:hypothetical protein
MKKYFWSLLLVTLMACELVVDVAIPPHEQKITINSIFTPDSTMVLKLSLSNDILKPDNMFDPVTDAEIIINQGEGGIAFTHKGYGVYESDMTLNPDIKSYTVEINSPNYGQVKSSSTLPNTPEVLDHELIVEPSGEFGNTTKVNVQIKDEAGIKNFYQLKLIVEYTYTGGDGVVYHQFSEPQTLPAVNENDNEIIGEANEDYIKDVLFDGKEKNLSFYVYSYMSGGDTETKYHFYLGSLSEEMFLYKSTTQLQQRTSGDPFAQPVTVFNNIEGGYGIFAGYSQTYFVEE